MHQAPSQTRHLKAEVCEMKERLGALHERIILLANRQARITEALGVLDMQSMEAEVEIESCLNASVDERAGGCLRLGTSFCSPG